MDNGLREHALYKQQYEFFRRCASVIEGTNAALLASTSSEWHTRRADFIQRNPDVSACIYPGSNFTDGNKSVIDDHRLLADICALIAEDLQT